MAYSKPNWMQSNMHWQSEMNVIIGAVPTFYIRIILSQFEGVSTDLN